MIVSGMLYTFVMHCIAASCTTIAFLSHIVVQAPITINYIIGLIHTLVAILNRTEVLCSTSESLLQLADRV